MLKHYAFNEAPAGSFALPILLTHEEIFLTSITLHHIAAGDPILLEITITWERPMQWDTGEMEVFIRKDSPTGPIIYWNEESCFLYGKVALQHWELGTDQEIEVYYLTTKSNDSKARVIGPVSLKGSVISL